MEPASAFSVYAAKRKNSEQLLNSKKKKKCQSQKTSSQKSGKHKEIKETSVNQHVKDKGIFEYFCEEQRQRRCH